MPRRPVTLPPSVVPLPQEDGRPLRWRLHQGLKAAILNGQFPPGERLPSTRTLAKAFGVSRTTVVEAFDQLSAEGFVDRRAGSGTYVSRHLGDLRIGGDPAAAPQTRREPARRAPQPDGQGSTGPLPFKPCEPDVSRFPHQLWARLLARHARGGAEDGPRRLREALAAYLTWSRGVRTDPGRVIVVSGARQALHLATHTLLDPDDGVWFEDPGYEAARATLTLGGVRAVPIPVDGDGLDVSAGRRLAPQARAAYVTPSHQFPTGALMGLGRRLQLLAWAAEQNAWIFEDDYDSEFCYDGRPLPALQGLDEQRSVVYLGTLNKIMYPGLRVGYAVVPSPVAAAFEAVAQTMALGPPTVVQAALADFVAEGHLARHITRMRALYRERREVLVAELRRHRIQVAAGATGMHVLAKPPPGGATAEVAGQGLDLRVVGGSLVLGYTHMPADLIRTSARRLAAVLGQPRIRAS